MSRKQSFLAMKTDRKNEVTTGHTYLAALVGALFLSGCDEPADLSKQSSTIAAGEFRPAMTASQSAQEVALVRSLFTQLQPVSIQDGVEYCGFIGFDASGQMVATQPERGRIDSCLIDNQGPIEVVTASYHTHGAYTPNYFNELPSMTDVEGDEADGIDGYVATPGGRLWYVDSSDRVLSQLCGLGCLPSDPNFVVGDNGFIAQSYTYAGLQRKLNE